MKPLSKSRTRYLLVRRTDAEWLDKIRKIRHQQTRLLCANIVWFDYFSETERPHDAHALDQFRHDWDFLVITRAKITVRPPQLEKALERIGYHRDLAKKRAAVLAE